MRSARETERTTHRITRNCQAEQNESEEKGIATERGRVGGSVSLTLAGSCPSRGKSWDRSAPALSASCTTLDTPPPRAAFVAALLPVGGGDRARLPPPDL
eukprot:1183120-Prorocentrum_minimum.AAC.2